MFSYESSRYYSNNCRCFNDGFKGFNFEKEKSLVEIGDLEITATEKEHVSWSTYAGGGVLVLGAVVTIMGFRKESKA